MHKLRDDAVILLTGASGGLGLELAEQFLAQGLRKIAFQYRSQHEKLSQLLQRFEMPESRHLFQADLTQEEQVKSLKQSIDAAVGPVGCLINLAGGSTNSMSWKMSLSDFEKIVNANLTSTFLCSREFIPDMRNKNYGRIVNVSSVVAFTGAVGASHYSAAKAGIVGLTKAMARELANKNITVNALALGYFNRGLINDVPAEMQSKIKDQIPNGRFGATNEIFGALEFLLSDSGAYTTGQTLHINGGLYL